MATSGERMTKYPAHSALVKVRKRKNLWSPVVGKKIQSNPALPTPPYMGNLLQTVWFVSGERKLLHFL